MDTNDMLNIPDAISPDDKPQKTSSWKLILAFIVLLIILVVVFHDSEFVSAFVLFSPIILFLLFCFKTVSRTKTDRTSPFRLATTILGILAIQGAGLFFGITPFFSFDNSPTAGEMSFSKYSLIFTIVFPIIIWVVYYSYKKKNSAALIIITSLPIIIALFALKLLSSIMN